MEKLNHNETKPKRASSWVTHDDIRLVFEEYRMVLFPSDSFIMISCTLRKKEINIPLELTDFNGLDYPPWAKNILHVWLD